MRETINALGMGPLKQLNYLLEVLQDNLLVIAICTERISSKPTEASIINIILYTFFFNTTGAEFFVQLSISF